MRFSPDTATWPLRRALLPAALLAGFTLNRFPPAHYPFYPACPIHQWTGLECPGCGLTRALAALTHGHLTQAIHSNVLVLILLPLAVYLLSRCTLPRTAWIALTAVIVVFTIARNVCPGW